ncbi:glycosyltransferase [Brumimicrobium mesophilum]|uniref:glycosyltransferase n=1 Tax=Brumimicrobium mesophilum TaxID=392717 RepID=UPI000D144215|nr:glycosyltransferase [Brumimicrobium mesophilum]
MKKKLREDSLHSLKTYKKLVVITSRFPFPLEKGDKLRAYHQIKELSKHFEVHLISTSEIKVEEDHIQELNPYCKSINIFPISILQKVWGAGTKLFNRKPIQVGYFHHYSIQLKINKLLSEIKPDHIYCQLVRSSEYVKNYHDCPKTIDYMDALSKGLERRSLNAKRLSKFVFESEYKRLMNYENSIFEYFEHHTIISKQDKQYIFHKNRDEIVIIPNGVDDSFLEIKNQHPKTVDLVFIGNMSYPPNVTASQFIVNDILPLLSNNLKVKIAGSNPSKEVMKLANTQVEITGYVDDIKEAYRSAKIFVAPMFLGTGLQNKLLEAMALGIPCITTSMANNALGAKPEKEILIADSAESFANQIKRLQDNPELYQLILENGRTFIMENYEWSKVTDKLIQLIRQ